MGIPFYHPKPHPPAAFSDAVIPDVTAHPLSRLFFSWVTPLLKVGYSRPLEHDDLWSFNEARKTQSFGDRLEQSFYSRLPTSRRPQRYRPRDLPQLRSDRSSTTDMNDDDSSDHGTKVGSPTSTLRQYPPEGGDKFGKVFKNSKVVVESGAVYKKRFLLPKALASTFKRDGLFCLTVHGVELALETTAPLLTQQLIKHVILANAYHKAQTLGLITDAPRPPALGATIGIAFGLFGMMQLVGMFGRQAVIDLVGRKSMRMSSKARLEFPNGRMTTMLTSDAAYVESSAQSLFDTLLLPLQIVVGIALLIHLLGVSAFVGLGVLVFSSPIQGFLFRGLTKAKKRQLEVTDERTRLSNEVLNNIRVIKMYAWERLFQKRVLDYRQRELYHLRRIAGMRSSLMALMSFLPTLAAVLTFITYAVTGHTLEPSAVFAALQLFNILKTPLTILPVSVSDLCDCYVAVQRLGSMLESDEGADHLDIDLHAQNAVVISGNFTFEEPFLEVDKGKHNLAKNLALASPNEDGEVDRPAAPFQLKDLDLTVPHGSLVCIVGRVGVGKSALLAGMLQELRQISGRSQFGGSVSYVPQQAWIMSGTIRSNIVFGQEPVDEERLQRVIDACALRRDLSLMSDGLETEIGEKGINLSGGQRQRLSLCRAAMAATDIVLMDDPLSAVDAHVGKHILERAILRGPLAGRTRILVTHHLSALPYADHIVVMDRAKNAGRIVQQGTYERLMQEEGLLREMMQDHKHHEELSEETKESENLEERVDKQEPKLETATMKIFEDEGRETGAISWKMYKDYVNNMGSDFAAIVFLNLMLVTVFCNVGTTLFLGFWTGRKITGFDQGHYIEVYGGLGVAQAILMFLGFYIITRAGISASYKLFNKALTGVLRSPTRWFDVTPVGRIISRLSKDIQLLDDRLPPQLYRLMSQTLSILGTVGLVFYVFPYLGIMFVPLAIFYYFCGLFYSHTSREIKRVDSNLRSHVYSRFGEQIQGITVIKAFQQQERFASEFQKALDSQGSAYFVMITIQQWLMLRMDFCGNLLILGIALFAAGTRETIDPSKVGVVLTYTITSISLLSILVNVYARVEQQMNGVERVKEYCDLKPEAATNTPHDPAKEQWPSNGELTFENVELRFRPELPLVLKGLSFHVRPGEKVGIVGRTGAGKSSLAQALFRSVELAGGSISIDGLDLRKVGLDTLRSRLSIIPQDGFLFSGTVRDNIDPEGCMSDADLNEALRRSGLVHDKMDEPGLEERFEKYKLDSMVADEGGNFSAGEKQLLALARAIVKNSKVLIMDEATSSVDAQTDALIQAVIQAELSNVTLLCIAHRLQTIAYYDRILVLDAGKVVEYDEPLVLFDRVGTTFRELCDKAKLTRESIVKLRAAAALARQNVSASRDAAIRTLDGIASVDNQERDVTEAKE